METKHIFFSKVDKLHVHIQFYNLQHNLHLLTQFNVFHTWIPIQSMLQHKMHHYIYTSNTKHSLKIYNVDIDNSIMYETQEQLPYIGLINYMENKHINLFAGDIKQFRCICFVINEYFYVQVSLVLFNCIRGEIIEKMVRNSQDFVGQFLMEVSVNVMRDYYSIIFWKMYIRKHYILKICQFNVYIIALFCLQHL